MTVVGKSSNRLLLYIDILGFREMVKEGEADRVRDVLSSVLKLADTQANKRSVRLGSKVETIYFSDTILIYVQKSGFSQEAFKQLRFAAIALSRALLAKDIPICGVLTYGNFVIDHVGDPPKPVYFGQALIDAYDRDKQEKWIGVLVCPSVTEMLSETTLTSGMNNGIWMVRGEAKSRCLLLNPFSFLKPAFNAARENTTLASLEPVEREAVEALSFICLRSRKFIRKADFSSNVAVRYHATAAFARAVLGDDCVKWALALRD